MQAPQHPPRERGGEKQPGAPPRPVGVGLVFHSTALLRCELIHCTACPLNSAQCSGVQHTHSSSQGHRQPSPLSVTPKGDPVLDPLPLSPQPQATTDLFSVWIRLCGHFTSVGLHSRGLLAWPLSLSTAFSRLLHVVPVSEPRPFLQLSDVPSWAGAAPGSSAPGLFLPPGCSSCCEGHLVLLEE